MPFMMTDAAIASGQAFLNGELEKRHADILTPLSNTTWSRDIPFEMGGGAMEYVSNMFADFATSGTNEDGIINGATNVIPVIQANLSKDLVKVFPWASNLQITFINLWKLMNTGRSMDPILQEGIQLAYNKVLDKNVYTGLPTMGTTGLVNDATVTAANVALGAASSRLWTLKTPDEIVADFNALIMAALASSEYSEGDIINQVNIPPLKYSYLVGTRIGTAAQSNILNYVLENNYAASRGKNLQIVPCRQCIGAGASGTDRMVGYVNRKDRIAFDITQPLTKGQTEASVKDMAYYTNYLSFFSQIQIKSYQTIRYADGF